MKPAFPAALAALSLLLAPMAQAQSDEVVGAILGELLRDRGGEGGGSDDQRTGEAAAIVGTLLGLAALERALREEEEDRRAPEAAPAPPPVEDLAPVARAPARPAAREDEATFEDLAIFEDMTSDDMAALEAPPPREDTAAADPAPEILLPPGPPLAPPTVIGEPSLQIPPPPPFAEAPSDVTRALDQAAREGGTGF